MGRFDAYDIYYTYACKSCAESADEGCETPIVKAPREKNIIPGSFATPEAIAHIMTQKFVMGSPLYRQEQEMNRKGIQLSRQTMSNWILKAAEDYLTPYMSSCIKNCSSGMFFTQMRRRCRCFMSLGKRRKATAICGCTGPVGIQRNP